MESGPGRLTPCRTCGVEIWWLETAKGRPMPLDPRPHPAGNVVVGTRRAETAAEDLGVHRPAVRVAIVLGHGRGLPDGLPANTLRWVPHWATCSRRPRRRDERPCRAIGCGRLRPRHRAFCGPHWSIVPMMLKATLIDAMGALRRREPNAQRMYADARRAAIACVLEAETRRGAIQGTLDLEAYHAS